MQSNKSPGHDGLTKEFYKTFWNQIKQPFINSIMEAREEKKLSTSQRQAVIKLIEKKERDKQFIKNWRSISLPNFDYKTIAKALATRLKETLPKLISFQQMTSVKNRFIGEGGRLISDILEIYECLNLKGYIVTVDIEKAFDSLSHFFYLLVLKNMDMEMTLENGLKYYLNVRSLVLLMEVIRQNILNFKKVLNKAIQFLHIYLFYVLKLYSF